MYFFEYEMCGRNQMIKFAVSNISRNNFRFIYVQLKQKWYED